MNSSSTANGSDNEVWNETHIALVQDLEKRGTLWRYSAKHLKLWTDDILSGNSGGINDEPKWEEHIEAISFPPKTKKSTPATKVTTVPQTSTTLLEMMMLQQQQRSDLMQTAMLACLSNSPSFQVSPENSFICCVLFENIQSKTS